MKNLMRMSSKTRTFLYDILKHIIISNIYMYILKRLINEGNVYMNILFSPFREGWIIAVVRRNLKHETET